MRQKRWKKSSKIVEILRMAADKNQDRYEKRRRINKMKAN